MRRAFAWLAGASLTPAALGPVDAADKKRPALEPGSVPHDALGRDIEGNDIHISDHQGKVVIVSFWASWCEPCKKELPVLAGLAKRVGPDHMKIIAINFLKEYPITMLRDSNGKAARKYLVRGIPRMIIIGRDGKVAADHTGYGESALPGLVYELNKLLAATN